MSGVDTGVRMGELMGEDILEIENLSVRFPRRYGPVSVLDNINLSIGSGERLAIVGESGCGKSILGLAVSDLLPSSAVANGRIEFLGTDVRSMSKSRRRSIRGQGIGIVYQDAMTSLNPGMSVGSQLTQVCKRSGAEATPAELLESVRLGETRRILRAKPYQLSGGQRQRVLIALALARNPRLVVADEPTTALDVTVQAQIMELLLNLQSNLGFALLFISHDLALVSEFTQRIAIMYAGQIVETGLTTEVLQDPRHPYTAGLVSASVSLEEGDDELKSIPGQVRRPESFLEGCRFRDRCERVTEICSVRPRVEEEPGRDFACHHPYAKTASVGRN
ncbi:ABC transporter ATP-binding protein [Prauserella endophytica]|uniref:Nickel import system ATP-binding protein NikD n=1 Tax=Prauserella endophytica TaxID=1592324 RepID=A0ABY2RZP8_9PSEU|nr:ABC transporter ATP-binding protein [Prauserella endophytica]TKG66641.1 ABC transporter ATP-binding protein [Prauserella endophytica]